VTSLGYVGNWGGTVSFDGTKLYQAAYFQRVRADVAYWWTPRVATSVQVGHDLVQQGDYSLRLAITGRVTAIF
jgi:hypothetical protein